MQVASDVRQQLEVLEKRARLVTYRSPRANLSRSILGTFGIHFGATFKHRRTTPSELGVHIVLMPFDALFAMTVVKLKRLILA